MRDTDFVQKHFVSATNVSSLRSPRNIMGNNVSSFTSALNSALSEERELGRVIFEILFQIYRGVPDSVL